MEPDEYARMDAAEDRMWWYRALHARLLTALRPVRGRVLDAGCGTGGFLALLGARRPDLVRVGCEWSASASRAAGKSGAAMVRGSVSALPFAPASFDAAVAADVLCHAAVDPALALAELARILRPGGVLLVNMPAYRWLHSAHDRRVHNARRVGAGEMRAALRGAGLRPHSVAYWNGLLLPLMVAHRLAAARHAATSDVALFPPWLDATLYGITVLERRLLPRLPAGGSVFAVARRI